MAGAKDSHLPPDLMESQLLTIELIRAMYPPAEDNTDSSTQELINSVREWCENPSAAAAVSESPRLPSSISFTVTIPLTMDEDGDMSPSIEINIIVPLTTTDDATTESPPLQYSLRQPPWMSRAEVTELGASMPPGDLFAAFDYIQEHAPRPPQTKTSSSSQQQNENSPSTADGQQNEPLLRVWFYFPSLSTREKRKDLVSYAAGYGLTGFVLAGKPGVLCLEGTSRAVDGYMNAIKNESWGDIPSHQKKVSERFREEISAGSPPGCGGGPGPGRRFEGMTEITEALGARHGARKNRGDMAALEAYLKERGVGDSFAKVVMGQ